MTEIYLLGKEDEGMVFSCLVDYSGIPNCLLSCPPQSSQSNRACPCFKCSKDFPFHFRIRLYPLTVACSSLLLLVNRPSSEQISCLPFCSAKWPLCYSHIHHFGPLHFALPSTQKPCLWIHGKLGPCGSSSQGSDITCSERLSLIIQSVSSS